MTASTPSPNDEPTTPAWLPVVGALLLAALIFWWLAPGRSAVDATVRVRATAADAHARPVLVPPARPPTAPRAPGVPTTAAGARGGAD